MSSPHTLEQLEDAVLVRIARHREELSDRASLSAGTLLVLVALTAGLIIGVGRARQPATPAASVVVAKTASRQPCRINSSIAIFQDGRCPA